MREYTQLEILARIYDLINVSEVTSLLGDQIYYPRSILSQGQDLDSHIVINSLPGIPGDDNENDQFNVNINVIYPKKMGIYDVDDLDLIVKAVLNVLNQYDQQDDGIFLDFNIVNHGLIPEDVEEDEKYVIYNIRIETFIQKRFEEGE